jgi:hypothetical protein
MWGLTQSKSLDYADDPLKGLRIIYLPVQFQLFS